MKEVNRGGAFGLGGQDATLSNPYEQEKQGAESLMGMGLISPLLL